MRYLFIDISLAQNYIDHKLGSEPDYNRLMNKVIEYKDKMNALPNTPPKKEFSKLCNNFDSFCKRNNILY